MIKKISAKKSEEIRLKKSIIRYAKFNGIKDIDANYWATDALNKFNLLFKERRKYYKSRTTLY